MVPVTPPVAAVTPPPAAAPAPPATVPGRAVAVTTPATNVAPAAKGATVASIPFTVQSADLSDVAKSELDRVAKNINDKTMRQVELRAFATGADPESRKIALARALVVRSYLIDRGVKSRIEVGGFAGGDGERVDIVVPNT
jgi:outer membrane protein OmpA-like peptidoglycan-associated protein